MSRNLVILIVILVLLIIAGGLVSALLAWSTVQSTSSALSNPADLYIALTHAWIAFTL